MPGAYSRLSILLDYLTSSNRWFPHEYFAILYIILYLIMLHYIILHKSTRFTWMTRDNHSIVIVETPWNTQIPIPSVVLKRFKFGAPPAYTVGADLLVNRNAGVWNGLDLESPDVDILQAFAKQIHVKVSLHWSWECQFEIQIYWFVVSRFPFNSQRSPV